MYEQEELADLAMWRHSVLFLTSVSIYDSGRKEILSGHVKQHMMEDARAY